MAQEFTLTAVRFLETDHREVLFCAGLCVHGLGNEPFRTNLRPAQGGKFMTYGKRC